MFTDKGAISKSRLLSLVSRVSSSTLFGTLRSEPGKERAHRHTTVTTAGADATTRASAGYGQSAGIDGGHLELGHCLDDSASRVSSKGNGLGAPAEWSDGIDPGAVVSLGEDCFQLGREILRPELTQDVATLHMRETWRYNDNLADVVCGHEGESLLDDTVDGVGVVLRESGSGGEDCQRGVITRLVCADNEKGALTVEIRDLDLRRKMMRSR